jgi:urease accessory protein
MIAVLAHVGGGIDGFWDGLIHPFIGLDHVLAMVTVGVLAMTMARPFAGPAVFLGAMALGGALGMAGVSAPGAEVAIALSVVALAVLLIAGSRLRSSTVFALVGAAGLAHGHAHGAEAPSAVHPLIYMVGFILATAALHVSGVGLGTMVRHRAPARRTLGGLVLCAGAGLTLGVM